MSKMLNRITAIAAALIMMVTDSLACGCVYPSNVRTACYKLTNCELITVEELEALSAVFVGSEAECEVVRNTVLRLIVFHMEQVRTILTETEIDGIICWLSMCHCGGCGEIANATAEETPVVTVAPTTTPEPTKKPPVKTPAPTATPAPHVHHGGTHENGGTCTGCGEHYEIHEAGSWVAVEGDGTWHHQYCVSCSYQYGVQYHTNGGVISTDSSGTMYVCAVCGMHYWRANASSSHWCCAECGSHDCCLGCSCGCDHD